MVLCFCRPTEEPRTGGYNACNCSGNLALHVPQVLIKKTDCVPGENCSAALE